ncbi:hypothetical protein [Brevundimonas sp. LjRoot202]|uniref:terminase small subunit-like protein n=1 Tax=Brevundimonas sp. LjRoot202 TaxID=3342281 RepID=UPI003ECD2CC9
MARPTLFNESLAEAICLAIADGRSLRSICADGEYPDRSTVFRWLADPANVAFRDQYALAREASADADDDDIRDIAARVEAGKIEPQAARVAIDAKKWSAGKRKPKVYGDASVLRHTGPDGGPVQFANMTEAEIDARLAALAGGSEPAAPSEEG